MVDPFLAIIPFDFIDLSKRSTEAVSYTHLDVYKRQPFLGICGGLTKIGMSDLPALEIPYLLFAAEILICCYITKKKISVDIPDGGNRVSG